MPMLLSNLFDGADALLQKFEEPEIPKTPPAYPFPILSPEEAADCPNAVPVFDIKIAAGDFSKEQWLQDCQYAELPTTSSRNPDSSSPKSLASR